MEDAPAGRVRVNERAYRVRQRLRPAMVALRDTEDWARLELRDELLATRIREIHESLTADVLNGNTHRYSARQAAALWERYALWRGHDPHEGAARRARAVRQLRFLSR